MPISAEVKKEKEKKYNKNIFYKDNFFELKRLMMKINGIEYDYTKISIKIKKGDKNVYLINKESKEIIFTFSKRKGKEIYLLIARYIALYKDIIHSKKSFETKTRFFKKEERIAYNVKRLYGNLSKEKRKEITEQMIARRKEMAAIFPEKKRLRVF